MENSILNFHFVFRNPSLRTFWHYFKNRLKQSFFEFFLFQVFDVYCHSNVSPSSLHSEVPTENIQCCKISMLVIIYIRLYKLLLEAGNRCCNQDGLNYFPLQWSLFLQSWLAKPNCSLQTGNVAWIGRYSGMQGKKKILRWTSTLDLQVDDTSSLLPKKIQFPPKEMNRPQNYEAFTQQKNHPQKMQFSNLWTVSQKIRNFSQRERGGIITLWHHVALMAVLVVCGIAEG